MHVVVSGQETPKTLGPGAFFGELCLLDGQAPTATVVALGEPTDPLVGSPGGGRCSMWVEAGSDVITISLDKDGENAALPSCQLQAAEPTRSRAKACGGSICDLPGLRRLQAHAG